MSTYFCTRCGHDHEPLYRGKPSKRYEEHATFARPEDTPKIPIGLLSTAQICDVGRITDEQAIQPEIDAAAIPVFTLEEQAAIANIPYVIARGDSGTNMPGLLQPGAYSFAKDPDGPVDRGTESMVEPFPATTLPKPNPMLVRMRNWWETWKLNHPKKTH